MEASGESYEHVLKAHLDVNPRSWAALQERGVDEQTPLQLDFEYTAPGEAETRSLLRFLRTETDYEFKGGARTQADGAQRWLVLGTTSPMTLSLDALNEWVTQMTAYGREHGPARFDGWGARTPESAPTGAPAASGSPGAPGASARTRGPRGSVGAAEEVGGAVPAATKRASPTREAGPAGKAGRGQEAGPAEEAGPAGKAGRGQEAGPAEEPTAPKGLLGRLLRGRFPR